MDHPEYWTLKRLTTSISNQRRIRNRPIIDVRLSITKNQSSNKLPKTFLIWRDRRVRSKPLLFNRALGIKEDGDYVEDRAKWRALRASGLFKNLTSQMTPQKCIHQARLVISGEELPSIRFSPEFSIGSSLANPDVEGGIRFVDKNFLGLGQHVDFSLRAKKAAKMLFGANTSATLPRIELSWRDMTIGRKGYVSAGLHAEENVVKQNRIFWSENFADRSKDGQRELLSWRSTLQSKIWMRANSVHSLRDGQISLTAQPFLSSSSPIAQSEGVEGLARTALQALKSPRTLNSIGEKWYRKSALFGGLSSSGIYLLAEVDKKRFRGNCEYETGVVASTPTAFESGAQGLPYHHLTLTAKSNLFNRPFGVNWKLKANDGPAWNEGYVSSGSSNRGQTGRYERRAEDGNVRSLAPRKLKFLRVVGNVAVNMMSAWGPGFDVAGADIASVMWKKRIGSISPHDRSAISPGGGPSSLAWLRPSLDSSKEFVASCKVDARATGLNEYVVPGVYAESTIQSSSKGGRESSHATQEVRYRNTLGIFVKGYAGLRADVSWKVGDAFNKFRFSLKAADE